MRNLFLSLFVATLFTNPAATQGNKQDLVNKITEKHQWLYAYAVNKTVTANLSESMWAMVLGEAKNPKGYSTFKRLGKAFADLSDKFGGTTLEKKCGFAVNTVNERDNRAGCQSAIDAWGGKYALTLNAASVPAGNDAFKMVTGYVSSVAIYLETAAPHSGTTAMCQKAINSILLSMPTTSTKRWT